MKEKLETLLDLLIKGIEKGAAFADANAQPLFEEFYRYLLAKDIYQLIISILFTVGFIIAFKAAKIKINKVKEANKYDDENMLYWISLILCAFGIVISLVCIADNAEDVLTGVVAPKIYVIKGIKDTLK